MLSPTSLSVYVVSSAWALLKSNNLSLALKRTWVTVYLGDETLFVYLPGCAGLASLSRDGRFAEPLL